MQQYKNQHLGIFLYEPDFSLDQAVAALSSASDNLEEALLTLINAALESGGAVAASGIGKNCYWLTPALRRDGFTQRSTLSQEPSIYSYWY